jgi:tetratricopeptide (TPR) repeat protein
MRPCSFANAERELATVERERAELARDRALLQRLFDLRIEALGVASTSLADLDAMYGQAFRDYGVDLDAADVVPALERFRQRGLALEVALALDEWGPHRRRHHGPNSAQAENLFNLAMDLDQDPLRQRLRLAIAEGDLATLLELASPECLPHLGPGSIAVLGMAITFGWRTEIAKVSRLLEEALALHPGDYVLQCMGAEIHERFGRADAALVCRMAAWSLQPKDAGAHLEACRTLLGNGRLVDAERAARALSNAHPEHARGWRVLGTSLLALGDLVGARAAIERSLHLEDEAGARTALLIARYLAGDAEVEEVQRAVLVEVDSEKLADLLFALVMHQDPERREPGFALRMLEERPNLASGGAGIEFLEGIVRTRLEDWEGALEIIEGRYRYLSSVAQHAGSLDFIRALLYARLERRAEAREAHALGMVRFQQIVGPDDSPWAASHLVMWRREAEAAMAW